MLQARDRRIRALIKGLLALVFISKISLGSFIPVPRSFSFILFQQGMHPYLNVLLCFLLGVPLLILGTRVQDRNSLSGFYKLFCFLLAMTLVVQTAGQIYLGEGGSGILQLAALGSSLLMIAVYGISIPTLMSADDFLKSVQKWAGIFVLLSLVMWVLRSGYVFKGGRFIGVFKHIPHMVTCATVAFVFSLGTYALAQSRLQKLWSLIVAGAGFFAIVLTGTRSSAAAAFLALALMMILVPAKSNGAKILKTAVVALGFTFTLFFGAQSFNYAVAVATGQSSLGSRQAQDGVASRWEEVERGAQSFQEKPWIGHGLLSKFSSGEEADVSHYNAMKDPHNIFVSAGVTGGWPMVFLSVVAVIFMVIGSLKAMASRHKAKSYIAIYLAAHIPILIIYHIHLSIGGMADRLYWLVFGFVATSMFSVKAPMPKGVLNKKTTV